MCLDMLQMILTTCVPFVLTWWYVTYISANIFVCTNKEIEIFT
jgi:hypothetical protein